MLPSLFNKLSITRLGAAASTPDAAHENAQSNPCEGRSGDHSPALSQGLSQLNLDECPESSGEEGGQEEEDEHEDQADVHVSGSDRSRDSFEHVVYEDSDEYSNWSIPYSAPVTPTLASPTQSLPAPSTQEDDPLPLLPPQHRNELQEYQEEHIEQLEEQPEDNDQDDHQEAEPQEELPKPQLHLPPSEEHHEEQALYHSPPYQEEENEDENQEPQQQQHYELRLPLEIWVKICSYLYPSQLARFSLVNKAAYSLVASLESWEGWFKRLHGKAHNKLRYIQGTGIRQEMHIMKPLPGLSISQSYMLFMCAISLQVCEKCFRRCDGKMHRGRLASMPLPVIMGPGQHPLPSSLSLSLGPPESIYDDWESLGETVDSALEDEEDEEEDDDDSQEGEQLWTIRMCRGCRIKHYEQHPEPIPQEITTSFLTKRAIREKYRLGNKEVQAITTRSHGDRKCGMPVTYWEAAALDRSRRVYGGDIGRLAAPRSLLRVMQVLNNRVYIYDKRRRVLEAGGIWLSLAEYKALKAAGLLSLLSL